jgi:hypothetical protein
MSDREAVLEGARRVVGEPVRIAPGVVRFVETFGLGERPRGGRVVAREGMGRPDVLVSNERSRSLPDPCA